MPTRLHRLAAHLSAKQTAALCLCGGLIPAGAAFAKYPLQMAHCHGSHLPVWLQLSIVSGLFVLGYALLLFAKSELENGIAAARWPEDEIESVRNLASRDRMIWCSVILLIAMVALLILHPRYNLAFWACFIFGQSLTQLSFTLRPPRETTTSWLSTSTAGAADPIRPLAPLQSDHWGGR